MSIFGSLFGGVGSAILGGLVNGLVNRRSAAADFDDNARLRWQMWQANNSYNHPAAVMARFREAGLNPNLIYGQMPQASQPVAVTKETKPYNFDFNWLLRNQLENSELNNALTRVEIDNKLQQQKINDVAMANTQAQTDLLKQRLSLDKRSSDDMHAESKVRRAISDVTLKDSLGNQSFWDKIAEYLGGDGSQGSGAPVRSGVNWIGSIAKQALGAYVSKKGKVAYALGPVQRGSVNRAPVKRR